MRIDQSRLTPSTSLSALVNRLFAQLVQVPQRNRAHLRADRFPPQLPVFFIRRDDPLVAIPVTDTAIRKFITPRIRHRLCRPPREATPILQPRRYPPIRRETRWDNP